MSNPDPAPSFSIGTDVEEVERFVSEGNATDVLFSPAELDYCGALPEGATRRAGTWCAKEAVIKALWPWIRLDTRRVEIVRDREGRPGVLIKDWDVIGAGVNVRVSISHTRRTASASAIAWGPDVHENDVETASDDRGTVT
jgi:holo-[acyl-carrier protein] synthase